MTWAAYLLGFILSYMLAGWLGFALGNLVGYYFGIHAFAIGPLNVLTATIGAGLALIAARILNLKDRPKV